ncbi:hypothetical protein E4U46_000093 [Claviceps purpurea]|nr:hypothetical protein E4U46_000093 [Claviceps purpurea]
MRLLTTLTFALGALALATGPVKSTTDQLAVNGDVSVNLDDATAVEGITKRDEEASPSEELEKRIAGGVVARNIQLPHIPNPLPITVAGVMITYNMVARWRMIDGRLTLDYVAQSLRFVNLSARRLLVEAMAHGANFYFRRLNVGRIDTGITPDDTETFNLVISPVNDEL